MRDIIERFVSYVKIDTQSDSNSNTTPSTVKQWVLANKLVEDIKNIGLPDVSIDENGYIMATLPSNLNNDNIPVIGFISHYDTSPDFSGTNVNPQIVENYNGKDIILNKEKRIILSPDYFEDLLQYKGQTLITTDGTTLLGADDKAGLTEIVTAMEYLINPEIKHGTIKVGFTPDEEIGRGAHKFDVQKFGADWAYTMDGSQIGELEYENFNAASATIHITGKSVHPGYAKGKMVNAVTIANEFISLLPENEVPQKTTGREGFFHVHHFSGEIEKAKIDLIIRDHDKVKFEDRKAQILQIKKTLCNKYGEYIDVEIKDQYYNMKEKIEPVMHIVDIAKNAMEALGIKPIIKPIRGGTDGSQLSYMGLPCPNIFAGGHNFHGKYEYVPVESMEKAVMVIVKICELTAK